MPVKRAAIPTVFLVLLLWGSAGIAQTKSGSAKSLEVDPVRILKKTAVMDASQEEVWRAFTTGDGVTTFFAPVASVELRVGGPYEMYFDLKAPEGSRAARDSKFVAFANRKCSRSIGVAHPLCRI